MRRTLLIFAAGLLASGFWVSASGGTGLPSFEDFRRIDQARRKSGQRVTDELLRASRIDAGLILRTAQQHADDPKLLWGAAELLANWPEQRKLFEQALAATGTNTGIALRFACAASKHDDAEVALPWARVSQKIDNDNTAPWVAELWWLGRQNQPMMRTNAPAVWTANFRDYSVEASRARIRLLEAAGYSPYAARRLGVGADSPALTMARELTRPPVDEVTATVLTQTAQVLEGQRQFLIAELVGQTIERSLWMTRPRFGTGAAFEHRNEELEKRREELIFRQTANSSMVRISPGSSSIG